MRTLLLAVALLAFAPGAAACDVCGCSIGGNYFGILPQFHRHFIGLRWSAETSYTALSADALRAGRFHSTEQFRSYDLMARFYPFRRWQTLVLAPYRDFSQTENGKTTRVRGLGDVSVLVNYLLWDTGDSLRHRWQQTLSLGGGLKLPSGKHHLPAADGSPLNPNVQPGTGSTDFLVSAAYTVRRGAWGISTDLLGRLTTPNDQQYRFGHRLSGSLKGFYWAPWRKLNLLPNAGVFADAAQANRDGDARLEGSEGLSTFATLGLDAYAGHWSAGFSFQPPIWQSRRTVQANARWTCSLNYIF